MLPGAEMPIVVWPEPRPARWPDRARVDLRIKRMVRIVLARKRAGASSWLLPRAGMPVAVWPEPRRARGRRRERRLRLGKRGLELAVLARGQVQVAVELASPSR